MTVEQGLDPERVRLAAAGLDRQAERVQQLHQQGTAMVGVLEGVWVGRDLDAFAQQWRAAAQSVAAMAHDLGEAAQHLRRQADEQEATSAASGGIGSASGPADAPAGGSLLDDLWGGIRDFGEGLLDAGEEVIDTVGDGLDWLGDRVEDGLDWLGGKADAALDWVGQQATALSQAGGRWIDVVDQGFLRLENDLTTLGGLFTKVFTEARYPRLAEVIAAGSLVLGSAVGVVGNALTGRDLHIFDNGRGEAVGSTPLSTDGPVGGHPQLRRPTSLDEILRSTTDAYSTPSTVRVTTVRQPDGSVVHIVNTPGTETWTPLGGSNPSDLTGNLRGVAGESTAAMQAVQSAMEAAGIRQGEPVLLVGHSQGGIINTALLTDPAFTSRYTITHAVTYGSPVDTFDLPPSVQQLNLEHASDVIPHLDLNDTLFPNRPNPDQILHGNGPNATRVVLPNPGSALDPLGNHSHANYADSVAASNDPRLRAYAQALRGFYAAQGATVTGVDVEVARRTGR